MICTQVTQISHSTVGSSFSVSFSASPDELDLLNKMHQFYRTWNMSGISFTKSKAQTSEIIEAYSRGYTDGADAVKATPQTFTAEGIVFAKMTEPNSSEKPNNCENEDIFEYCPRCGMRILVSKPKDEPQTDIHDLTDCDFCKDRNCKDCEGGKDEPQTDEHCETCRHKDKCESATYEYKNTEWWCLGYAPIDEPQTDCAWK